MEATSTHTCDGNRWRIELKNALLPHLKKGTTSTVLDNLSRKFVPHYFPPQTKDEKEGAWHLSPSFELDNEQKQEIIDVGRRFSEESAHLSHGVVKQIFKDKEWETEKPIPVIDLYDKRGNWKYDAYKDKIAVEVELSSRSQVFKDAFKFLIGQAMGFVDVGIIMVRLTKERNKPYFKLCDKYAHPIYNALPMINMAFYGF